MEPRRHTDGRIARGERTRAAIIAAHAALLREGRISPTAAQVAERAGVSVRTIWSTFKDREALLTESTEFWLAEDDALWEPIDLTLPLSDRITVYCRQRVRRLENIAPAARSATLAEPFSPVLRVSRRRHLDRMRDQIEHVFAAELDERAPADRVLLLNALVMTVSWPAWSTLRDDYEIGVDAAADAVETTLRALLGS